MGAESPLGEEGVQELMNNPGKELLGHYSALPIPGV